MKLWDERLNNQDFHGNKIPDEADFELFSAIKSKYNSKSF